MSAAKLTGNGWFRVQRQAVDLILNSFPSDRCLSALAVFYALCRLANDARGAPFEARIALVKNLSGVSYRTAITRLHDLAGLGLVAIQQQGGKYPDGPSTYTLTGCAVISDPSANDKARHLPTGLKRERIEETTPPSPELEPYISRFRNIRPEFTDQRITAHHIAEALRGCPAEPDRERGFSDFERDMAAQPDAPLNPVKVLRAYITQAALGPKPVRTPFRKTEEPKICTL